MDTINAAKSRHLRFSAKHRKFNIMRKRSKGKKGVAAQYVRTGIAEGIFAGLGRRVPDSHTRNGRSLRRIRNSRKSG